MKRFIVALCLVAFLVALPMSHLVSAAKKKKPVRKKVAICHIIEANDVVYGFWGVVDLHFGKEIEVATSAVPAHIEHGDSDTFFGGDTAAGPIQQFKDAGVNLPAADCYISVPIP